MVKWEKTNDKRALVPDHPIFCPICAIIEAEKENYMIHRFSSIGPLLPGSDATEEDKSYVVRMIFKCPECDFIAHFDVAISKEYFDFMMDILPGDNMRPDNRKYEPTKQEMEEQLPAYAKKRFQELGYF